jgi:hypothetical protein
MVPLRGCNSIATEKVREALVGEWTGHWVNWIEDRVGDSCAISVGVHHKRWQSQYCWADYLPECLVVGPILDSITPLTLLGVHAT